MKEITIAHSPDADDLFMYYAIVFGWITPPVPFKNIALDIQTLNALALKKTYPITAISFALYPLIAQDYALLRTGVSFGEGYGPKLIKRKGTTLKKNFKVALSGEHTSNALIFKIYYPQARIVYKNFLEIESAVLNAEVDAGVLIHESILNFDSRLEVAAHLWDIWLDLAQEELPLPLGGMAISRSIPLTQAIACENTLLSAVKVATQHQSLLCKMLLERKLVRVNEEELTTYLKLYANSHSICLDTLQHRAIDKLFELGYNAKFFSQKISSLDCMIPQEYQQLRFG